MRQIKSYGTVLHSETRCHLAHFTHQVNDSCMETRCLHWGRSHPGWAGAWEDGTPCCRLRALRALRGDSAPRAHVETLGQGRLPEWGGVSVSLQSWTDWCGLAVASAGEKGEDKWSGAENGTGCTAPWRYMCPRGCSRGRAEAGRRRPRWEPWKDSHWDRTVTAGGAGHSKTTRCVE